MNKQEEEDYCSVQPSSSGVFFRVSTNLNYKVEDLGGVFSSFYQSESWNRGERSVSFFEELRPCGADNNRLPVFSFFPLLTTFLQQLVVENRVTS
jgi:hypothetical protein